jgi:hypothetical protein
MTNHINCPQCQAQIDVSEVLYKQVTKEVKTNMELDMSERARAIERQAQEIKQQSQQIQQAKISLEVERGSIKSAVESQLADRLALERVSLEEKIRGSVSSEMAVKLELLSRELDEKSTQVRELHRTKAEVEQLKREKSEMRDLISYEKEKEFNDKLHSEQIRIKQQSEESFYLRIKDLEKQLTDQKELAEEMKRKAEQGSMQLQGEVQELALEEMLTSLFPFDTISEVAKGVKGADAIQTVRNRLGTDCGIILFESKRTKAFNSEWVAKLKADAVSIKADVCIIVSEVLPEGIEKIGYRDGVWICSFFDFKGLVMVIRDSLIKIHEAYSSQANKGEKMEMLYAYLTSNEFRLQLGSIVEGFAELQTGYLQERKAMERIWKQREKQIEKVMLNTNHFIGSVKGIAGSSLASIELISEHQKSEELKTIEPTNN